MLGVVTPAKSGVPVRAVLENQNKVGYYLMDKAVKEILLCHHFIPVPIHLLPKVGILALLQLDQGCDLLPKRGLQAWYHIGASRTY